MPRTYILGRALQKSIEQLVDDILARGEVKGQDVVLDEWWEGTIPSAIDAWRQREENLDARGRPRKYAVVEMLIHLELARRAITVRQEIW